MPDHVRMTQQAHDRLWHFIKMIDTEIGGFGFAVSEYTKEGHVLTVEDVFLVPQYASHAEVDFIDGLGVTDAINVAAEKGYLGREDFIWFSWHSHNTMKAYWSATDEQCIKDYGKQGIDTLLSLVGNHKGEYKLRLDHFGVEHGRCFIPQVTQDDMKYEPVPGEKFAQVDHPWTIEMRQAIKPKPKTTYTYSGYQGSSAIGYPCGGQKRWKSDEIYVPQWQIIQKRKTGESLDEAAARLANEHNGLVCRGINNMTEIILPTETKKIGGAEYSYYGQDLGWLKNGTWEQLDDELLSTPATDESDMVNLGRQLGHSLHEGAIKMDDLTPGEKAALDMWLALDDDEDMEQLAASMIGGMA